MKDLLHTGHSWLYKLLGFFHDFLCSSVDVECLDLEYLESLDLDAVT